MFHGDKSSQAEPGLEPWLVVLRMLPAEAITAATVNAAWAIGEEDCAGSLEVGKQADLLILDAPNHEHLCYHFGVNLVQTVVKNGKVVAERGQRVR